MQCGELARGEAALGLQLEEAEVWLLGKPPLPILLLRRARSDMFPAPWDTSIRMEAVLHSHVVARLNSLQISAADLAASAKFYGQFLGLELDDEPHQHSGNEALHYDIAWGDFASGDYMMLHLAQARLGEHTTGAEIGITVVDVDAVHQKAAELGVTVLEQPHDGEWGRNAVYQDPDGNIVSVTTA